MAAPGVDLSNHIAMAGEIGNQGKRKLKFEEIGEGNIPEWVDVFLQRTFFGPCLFHECQKNELNRYCITCNMDACRYCVSTDLHKDHELLKIHRHVYKDVVPLEEMVIHIDCAKIQPYKCNKKMVISLNPLPHCGSGELFSADASCCVCKRKLSDPEQYRFCSIACKVNAFHKGKSQPAPAASTNEYEEVLVAVKSYQKRNHSRKGIPCRAPFF